MFLIQSGHHSSTHIAEAIPDGGADGVIWSPADETPDLLSRRAAEVAERGATQALDPQLYIANLEDPSPKKLADHQLFDIPLQGRAFSALSVAEMVERVVDHQLGLPLTHLISPTVGVASMTNRSAQIALNLAETTLDLCERHRAAGDGDRPLLLSVAIERDLLADEESVNALLDEITSHEAEGFYLLFEIDPNLDGARQAQHLAEALYITYTLAVIQRRVVWVGYAGLAGYLYRAVGAEAFGAGWFQKQQWWSPAHWSGSGPSGGRPPRARIYLDAILGSLLVETELATIRTQRRDPALIADLLGGVGDLASAHRSGGQPSVDRAACAAQLFAVCTELDNRIGDDLQRNLARVGEDLQDAMRLFGRLDAAGVQLEGRSSAAQLRVWRAALDAFLLRAGIELEQ